MPPFHEDGPFIEPWAVAITAALVGLFIWATWSPAS